MTNKTYCPSGCTALFDAVHNAIKGVDQYMLDHPDEAVKPIIVIQTDGQENSSKYTRSDYLKKLINDRTQKGWSFTFLGANQDACLTAKTIGIDESATLSYMQSSDGTKEVMRTMSEGLSRARSGPSGVVMYTCEEQLHLSSQIAGNSV